MKKVGPHGCPRLLQDPIVVTPDNANYDEQANSKATSGERLDVVVYETLDVAVVQA